ncbi:hypothetical protein [Polaribacter septentrionalilitoris]|uniref:hypothetical protein n=1 Tax=Polaribacter septentrionalilitoris TaxID=2494657 RepID=UPI00135813F7|nr:hypothetical protein [Polaribacter septentrionalilitoris]
MIFYVNHQISKENGTFYLAFNLDFLFRLIVYKPKAIPAKSKKRIPLSIGSDGVPGGPGGPGEGGGGAIINSAFIKFIIRGF